jgi:hypothetical protein
LALDRQNIERDFPIGRRGYDPDAVDRHLRAIADEFEALRAEVATSTSRERESLSAAATEQVRAIVEAAETSAASIRREAEVEAKKTRADAAAEARDHVARVSEAAAALLKQVDAMGGELGALVESLRTGGNRLHADLALLQGSMGELRAAATGSDEAAVVEEALEEEAAKAAASEPEPKAVEEKEPTVEEKEPTVEEAAGANSDSEGARLVALNMALNGTSREETDRYLAENFDLHDRKALLDEVYARVG